MPGTRRRNLLIRMDSIECCPLLLVDVGLTAAAAPQGGSAPWLWNAFCILFGVVWVVVSGIRLASQRRRCTHIASPPIQAGRRCIPPAANRSELMESDSTWLDFLSNRARSWVVATTLLVSSGVAAMAWILADSIPLAAALALLVLLLCLMLAVFASYVAVARSSGRSWTRSSFSGIAGLLRWLFDFFP